MLNFVDSGAGPVVVLIHGLFGDLNNFIGCGKQLLACGYRTIRVDVVNHGHSPTLKDPDYQIMAAHIVEVLDHLSIQHCAVLGHSMGGKIAMMLALHYPERISKLIVADIAPITYEQHHTQVFAGLDELWHKRPNSRKEADLLLSQYIGNVAVRQFLLKNLKWTGGKLQWRLRFPEVKESYPNILYWPEMQQSYLGPTLFIKGSESDYITEQSRSAIQMQFPQAKAHIINGTGHWLHAEKPVQFNRVVERFLPAP